jgi:hypothetical protein
MGHLGDSSQGCDRSEREAPLTERHLIVDHGPHLRRWLLALAFGRPHRKRAKTVATTSGQPGAWGAGGKTGLTLRAQHGHVSHLKHPINCTHVQPPISAYRRESPSFRPLYDRRWADPRWAKPRDAPSMDITSGTGDDQGMENLQSRDPRRVTPTRRAFLTASAGTAAAVAAPLIGATTAAADHAAPSPVLGPGRPVTPQPPDRELRALLRDIDERRIEATVHRLVQFGTRHTLSSQDDPTRGIGAARDWIYAQVQSYAATSGGRMTVELQSFTQEKSPRIPQPTRTPQDVKIVTSGLTNDTTLQWQRGSEPDLLPAALQLTRGHAHLVVLPEKFLSGYEPDLIESNPRLHTVTMDDPRLAPIAQACRATATGAVVGAAVRENDQLFS